MGPVWLLAVLERGVLCNPWRGQQAYTLSKSVKVHWTEAGPQNLRFTVTPSGYQSLVYYGRLYNNADYFWITNCFIL